MPARMQVDLLRVLQEGTVCKVGGDQDEKVDVRFIAASHTPLDAAGGRGQVPRGPVLPPQRGRDRAAAAARAARRHPAALPALPAAVRRARRAAGEAADARRAGASCSAHPLPGNVRQLEHVLLQAWVLVEGPVIDADDLALDGERRSSSPIARGARAGDCVVPENLDGYRESEKRKILAALEAHGWNRARAAKSLGHAAAHVLPPPAGAPDPVGCWRLPRAGMCLAALLLGAGLRAGASSAPEARGEPCDTARRLQRRSARAIAACGILAAVHRRPLRALGHDAGRGSRLVPCPVATQRVDRDE